MPLNHYRLLGPSGLRVSPLCLGTMTFGSEWGWGADKNESLNQLNAYAEAGGNFIDTANLYTNGSSEKFLGDFLAEGNRRDQFVLATKYTFTMRPGDPNASGNHRKNLRQSLDASLQRLRTDHIDLYWVHAWDGFTQAEELMRSLEDAVRSGKVLHIGASDFPAWVISEANATARTRGWEMFTAIQVEYSLIERAVERDLLPMANHHGLGVTPWSPLGQGVLSGKYGKQAASSEPTRHQKGTPWGDAYLTDRNLTIADEVVAVARELGVAPVQVAIAWLLHQPGVTSPILGARTAKQLQDCLRGADLSLPRPLLDRLDAVSRIQLGFPHDFLSSGHVQDILTGGIRISRR